MEVQVNTVYMSLDVYDNMNDIINSQQRTIEVLSESENKFADSLHAIQDKIVCDCLAYRLEKREKWEDLPSRVIGSFKEAWGDLIPIEDVEEIYTMELENLIKQDKEDVEEIIETMEEE